MAGESSESASRTDVGSQPTGSRAAPWRRRVLLVPAVAVVVLVVAGFVVTALSGETLSPFASLFVGIVWSLAVLIVVTVVVGGVITWLLRLRRG